MITRCSNGHWYDSSVNRTCPHCKQESEKLSIRLDDVEEDDKTVSIAEAGLSLGEELGAIIGQTLGGQASGTITSSMDADGDKTISFGFFGVTCVQPVVGWLICMSGSERGRDYRLHTGKNFIGRSTSMDIALVDDKTISREKHCSVIYEPKSNSFYAASEGGNLVYRNDEMIETPTMLREGDVITVGETKLLFVPFCKEGRIWESE